MERSRDGQRPKYRNPRYKLVFQVSLPTLAINETELQFSLLKPAVRETVLLKLFTSERHAIQSID